MLNSLAIITAKGVFKTSNSLRIRAKYGPGFMQSGNDYLQYMVDRWSKQLMYMQYTPPKMFMPNKSASYICLSNEMDDIIAVHVFVVNSID